MSGGDLPERLRLLAPLTGIGAAGGEATSRRRVNGIGDLSGQSVALSVPAVEIGGGDGGEQCLGIGVGLMEKKLLFGCVLHHFAHIHHHDIGTDMPHHTQIVGDEHIGQALFILQIHQQVEDLCLNGDIKGGYGLVTDDELRINCQCTGQPYSLPPPAVQLMGIGVHIAVGQATYLHEFAHLVPNPLLAFDGAADPDRFGDDAADGQTGIQRGERVLKDHLHIKADLLHLGPGIGEDVFPVIEHLSAGCLQQAQDGPAEGGFAAAGLSHHAQGLSRVDPEADVVDGMEDTGGRFKVFFQVFRFNQWYRHCASPPL